MQKHSWGRGSAGSLAPLDGVRQAWGKKAGAGFQQPSSQWRGACPQNPEFQHVFCGLVMLADWIGSDDRFFPYAEPGDGDRIDHARAAASNALETFGISSVRARAALGSTLPGFAAVFGMEPRPVLRQNSARAASG